MTGNDFNELFESFRTSLFRLEQLPEYKTGGEDEPLRRWRAQEGPPADVTNTPWQQDLQRWKAQGKTMERVRLLRVPLSDYVRMSIEWWYPHNIAAGERTLAYDPDTHNVALPEKDFWLFDDEIVVLMHYDGSGAFIYPERLDRAEATQYVQTKRDLLAAAEDLDVVYRRLLADA